MGGEHYKPNPAVLERLKQVDFVAVVGPTASGKSTLIREAIRIDPSMHLVMNHTSRTMRDGEQEGVEYHFHTRAEMLARMEKGEYAQVAPAILGDLYATAPTDYSAAGISMLPVLADAVPIFAALPFASFSMVFVLPPDYDTWVARIESHNFTPEQKAKRLVEAARSLRFALEYRDTQFVINGNLQQATEDFMRRVRGELIRASEWAEQSEARRIAAGLLARIETV